MHLGWRRHNHRCRSPTILISGGLTMVGWVALLMFGPSTGSHFRAVVIPGLARVALASEIGERPRWWRLLLLRGVVGIAPFLEAV